MNVIFTKDGIVHYFKRKAYEIRLERAVRLANGDVERAFHYDGDFLNKRGWFIAGMGVAVIAAFSVISFAVTRAPESSTPSVVTTPISPVVEAPIAPVEKIVVAKAAVKSNSQHADNISPDFASLPLPDLDLPQSRTTSRYSLLVDKSRNELFVLEENKDNYKIVKSYPAVFGSKRGDKIKKGDLKTPEGLYSIVNVMNDNQLPAQYGPLAFVLDYPNTTDKQLGKTGHGIWIHGSGLGQRIEPTEGCVEMNDLNISDLGKFAGAGTPVFIYPEEFEVPMRNGVIQKEMLKARTVYAVKTWWAGELAKRESARTATNSQSSGS